MERIIVDKGRCTMNTSLFPSSRTMTASLIKEIAASDEMVHILQQQHSIHFGHRSVCIVSEEFYTQSVDLSSEMARISFLTDNLRRGLIAISEKDATGKLTKVIVNKKANRSGVAKVVQNALSLHPHPHAPAQPPATAETIDEPLVEEISDEELDAIEEELLEDIQKGQEAEESQDTAAARGATLAHADTAATPDATRKFRKASLTDSFSGIDREAKARLSEIPRKISEQFEEARKEENERRKEDTKKQEKAARIRREDNKREDLSREIGLHEARKQVQRHS